MSYVLKVVLIATVMAIVGTALPYGIRQENRAWILGFLPKVIVASNIFWVAAALMFRRKGVPLKWALEIGAASPFLGAILLGILFPTGFLKPYPGQPAASFAGTLLIGIWVYLMGAAAWFWIYIPIGMATAYLVYRTQDRESRPA